MALIIIYLLFLFLFFLLATIVKNIRKNINKTNSTYNLPKGPRKLPIIGNIHNLLTSQTHQKLRDLSKKYGPIMHLQLGEISTIVISSPNFASEVMKTHDINFAIRPQTIASKLITYNSTSIISSPYGNYWRKLRKICTLELLSLKSVNSFKPIREEEISNLVKWIASKKVTSPINLTQAIFSLNYSIVSKAAFGKKYKDQEKFILATKEAIRISGAFDLADLFPSITWLHYFTGLRSKLKRVHRKIDEIMENIINEHKEAKSKGKYEQGELDEDLIDILLKYEDGNNHDFVLTRDNIKAIILDIFGAGGETSASTIDWAMVEMIRNPRIMKKAQDEVRDVFKMKGRVDENYIDDLKYLKLVVKETMRLHPPAPFLLPRECGQECEIHGYHIPIKTKVIINAWAIARDLNYWTDPETFFPERFIDNAIDYKGNNFEYIPFGAGRRMCPGSIFGLRNVELTLATLLYHFDWKLPNGICSEELDMTEDSGVTMRRKCDFLLLHFPYHPLYV